MMSFNTLIYTTNGKGLSTDPWETPASIGLKVDENPSKWTLCCLSVKDFSIQS